MTDYDITIEGAPDLGEHMLEEQLKQFLQSEDPEKGEITPDYGSITVEEADE